ncbi:MAG: phosphatase PAP2 family protein [Chloroflexia bacterium]
MHNDPSDEPTSIENQPANPDEPSFDSASQADPVDPVVEDAVKLADIEDANEPDEGEVHPDLHSQHAVAFDLHSSPVDAPTTTTPISPEQIVKSEAAAQTENATPAQTDMPPPIPTTPAAQATQAVVVTAKQAAQTVTTAAQTVTAVVQQQAQKITVAPRKALYRGKRFLAVYTGLVGAAGILAILARKHRYFVGDVGITRFIQAPKARLYDKLMYAVSNLGWRWISVGARASAGTLMWAAGFRMESAFTFSTWTGDVLTVLIKTKVLRPRPTKDLVRVVSDLEEASFPSGHVVHYVTFYGFLFYLVFTHLKQRWFRTAFLTVLSSIIILIGPSRIYMGHHWPSDVGGAYLVGTLWLGLIIIAYIETKANYTLHTQPPFFIKRPKQLGT